MEHLIRYRTAEGIDGTHVAQKLDEAVAFVERLRNAEGAGEVRLYRLTEIPIEFKPYYKVEVGAGPVTAEPVPPITSRRPVSVEESPPVPQGDAGQSFSTELPESAAADGRRLFSRG